MHRNCAAVHTRDGALRPRRRNTKLFGMTSRPCTNLWPRAKPRAVTMSCEKCLLTMPRNRSKGCGRWTSQDAQLQEPRPAVDARLWASQAVARGGTSPRSHPCWSLRAWKKLPPVFWSPTQRAWNRLRTRCPNRARPRLQPWPAALGRSPAEVTTPSPAQQASPPKPSPHTLLMGQNLRPHSAAAAAAAAAPAAAVPRHCRHTRGSRTFSAQAIRARPWKPRREASRLRTCSPRSHCPSAACSGARPRPTGTCHCSP
mmetsp:Transcript_51625/g.166017  ORF Transcript_51625/g.166017 Transcript_51625/m.166017 type:complete len:257 (+) Transcript_51625:117-887(+)